jgi:hypothetical protein
MMSLSYPMSRTTRRRSTYPMAAGYDADNTQHYESSCTSRLCG